MYRFFSGLLIFAFINVAFFTPYVSGGIFDPFHTKEEKIIIWKALWDVHSGTEYYSVGKTYAGDDIWMFTVGNPYGGCLLWDGELHGNEDKGSELLFLIAKWLLESGDARAEKILKENYVMFIPVVNSNSERGNGNKAYSSFGVDLNRNFETGWQKSNPSDDTYSGPYSLSEPESQVLRVVFASYKPKFYVNMHCGAGPYAAYYNGGNTTLSEQAKLRANEISSEMGIAPYNTRPMGSQGFAMGDAVNLGVQSAWLIEAVGLDTAWRHLPEHYDELVNVYFPKCLALFVAMCSLIGSDVTRVEVPPKIQTVTQYPPYTEIIVDTAVQVNVTLAETAVGAVRVYLNYSINGKDWTTYQLAKAGKTLWSGQIPVFPPGSQILYTVMAENNAGSAQSTETMNYKYSYQVMPELPFSALMLILMLSTTMYILLKKSRRYLNYN